MLHVIWYVRSDIARQDILNMKTSTSLADPMKFHLYPERTDLSDLSEPIALILNKTFENSELPHDPKRDLEVLQKAIVQ